MKVIKNTLIATTAALFVIGCGGGGGIIDDIPDGDSYLRVQNSIDSYNDICNVYSNPSTSPDWGPDRLSGTIAPGYYREFSTSNCNINYDLKVVYCGSGYTDYYNNYYRACGATRTITFRDW